MKRRLEFRRLGVFAAVVALACVLGLYRPGAAAPKEPFANPVEQRAEMIEELRNINAQLRELNALLRSGAVKVELSQPEE